MSNITAPTRFETVGSFLRPERLKTARHRILRTVLSQDLSSQL